MLSIIVELVYITLVASVIVAYKPEAAVKCEAGLSNAVRVRLKWLKAFSRCRRAQLAPSLMPLS